MAKAVESFAARNYAPAKVKDYVRKCELLDEARREIVALRYTEDARRFKPLLLFYYTGLRYLNSLFIFRHNDDEAVNLSFSWTDSITGQEFTSEEGLELEMSSILFNLAAVMSNTASTMPISDTTVKEMSQEFQSAAWVFEHITKEFQTLDSRLIGTDFRSDNLRRLIALQLAQSQYCFFKKTEIAEMKPGIISKVCKQVHLYFVEAEGYVQGSYKNELEKY